MFKELFITLSMLLPSNVGLDASQKAAIQAHLCQVTIQSIDVMESVESIRCTVEFETESDQVDKFLNQGDIPESWKEYNINYEPGKGYRYGW